MILRVGMAVVLSSLAASAPADDTVAESPAIQKAALLAQAVKALDEGDPLAAGDCYRKAFHLAAQSSPANAQAILSELRLLHPLFQAAERIEELSTALANQPDDAAKRNELVRLLLAELNDPPAAVRWTNETVDAGLARWVQLAGRPVDSLSADEALDLARGYQSLAASASPVSRCRLLAGALARYQRFLAAMSATDPRSEPIVAEVRAVCEQLDRLSPSGPVALRQDEWVDIVPAMRNDDGMLANADPKPFWQDLPVDIAGAYYLEVEFMLLGPAGSFGVMAPCGDGQGHLFFNRPASPQCIDTLGKQMFAPSLVQVCSAGAV